MDRLLKLLELPIHILLWVGLFAGALMMLHTSAAVGARALNIPLIGTNEIASGYYMIAVAYLPWAYIARNDDHITVELFTRALSPAAMAWLDLAVKILTIVYVSIFTWETWGRAIQQTRLGEALEVGGAYLPVWPSRYMLPIAGGMMVLYLIIRVLRDFRNAVRG